MEILLAHCAASLVEQRALYLTLLVGGLTGGFTHCLAMCGPFVVCERLCAGKACGSAQPKNGLTYHLGRLTTYGALGFIVALLAHQVTSYSWWPVVASAMLAAAGAMFLLSCLHACRHDAPQRKSFFTAFPYLRGALLGFMPCGLLYAALMMAATLANPFSGMVAMWLFTLGTMPALLLMSGSAAWLARRWQQEMRMLGRVMMAFNGLSLLVMAATVAR